MALLIVRHGETTLNASRTIQTPDTPLSERGAAQAERVAKRLAAGRVKRVLASDYARARATAEAIGRASAVAVEILPSLRERHFGIHRGTAYADLEIDIFAAGYAPPGGESWPIFHARVDAAWAEVTAAQPAEGDLVVVTHALVCRAMAERQLGAIIDAAPGAGPFANTSVTEVEGGPPWRVERLACTAHLAGLA